MAYDTFKYTDFDIRNSFLALHLSQYVFLMLKSKMAAADTMENGKRNKLKTIWWKMMCDTCKYTDFDIRKIILALFSS